MSLRSFRSSVTHKPSRVTEELNEFEENHEGAKHEEDIKMVFPCELISDQICSIRSFYFF